MKARGKADPRSSLQDSLRDIRMDFDQIAAKAAEFGEREQMSDLDLAKEAHETEMIAASARLHLWARRCSQHRAN